MVPFALSPIDNFIETYPVMDRNFCTLSFSVHAMELAVPVPRLTSKSAAFL